MATTRRSDRCAEVVRPGSGWSLRRCGHGPARHRRLHRRLARLEHHRQLYRGSRNPQVGLLDDAKRVPEDDGCAGRAGVGEPRPQRLRLGSSTRGAADRRPSLRRVERVVLLQAASDVAGKRGLRAPSPGLELDPATCARDALAEEIERAAEPRRRRAQRQLERSSAGRDWRHPRARAPGEAGHDAARCAIHGRSQSAGWPARPSNDPRFGGRGAKLPGRRALRFRETSWSVTVFREPLVRTPTWRSRSPFLSCLTAESAADRLSLNSAGSRSDDPCHGLSTAPPDAVIAAMHGDSRARVRLLWSPRRCTSPARARLDWNRDFKMDSRCRERRVACSRNRTRSFGCHAGEGWGSRGLHFGVWTADIEMDGDLDLIIGEARRGRSVLRNNGDAWRRCIRCGCSAARVRMGRLDGDGDPTRHALGGGRPSSF